MYTPTVGLAIERFSHEFRRPRGVYLSVDHPEDVEAALRNTGSGPEDVDLLVATDSEGILGIGDQGVGGIEISVGKLAVYTAAAGLHPRARCRWCSTWAPTTCGCSTTRCTWASGTPGCRDERYDELIDAYVSASPSCSRTRCCTGRTSAPPTPGGSWTGTPSGGVHVQRRHAGHRGGRAGRRVRRGARGRGGCAISGW